MYALVLMSQLQLTRAQMNFHLDAEKKRNEQNKEILA
jgi:hypothetical protein